MKIGTVKWFNPHKGYGYIHPDDGSPNVFVDKSVVESAGMDDLKGGQRIIFEISTRPFWQYVCRVTESARIRSDNASRRPFRYHKSVRHHFGIHLIDHRLLPRPLGARPPPVPFCARCRAAHLNRVQRSEANCASEIWPEARDSETLDHSLHLFGRDRKRGARRW